MRPSNRGATFSVTPNRDSVGGMPFRGDTMQRRSAFLARVPETSVSLDYEEEVPVAGRATLSGEIGLRTRVLVS